MSTIRVEFPSDIDTLLTQMAIEKGCTKKALVEAIATKFARKYKEKLGEK